ncbi:branched-chain amino acid permease [Enterococcus sp. JM4C]|uniref:AzlC family ABC transporter permease n=1 Tax=Candidatus Enterococcus huntleyi TaxID=1857217 RepID=UPI001379E82B|nr:AzlC family ABC transporter permease [Enterococcus sp. JM4C]KAF1298103.1 branched-chain amino acid permease [Enterococcus sp. JM4C]
MEKQMKSATTFRAGVEACLPTVLGYLGIGIAAGVVGKSVGLSIFAILMMSVFIYAGSAQFIICGMIAIQAPVASIVFTAFLVNLRHFLMSMSVAPHFKQANLLESIGIGTLLTDESYGVLATELTKKSKVTVPWMNGLNIMAYSTWIIATVLGGLLGEYIPSPESFGLDFALIGMFIGLFVLQVDLPMRKRTRQTIIVLASVCVSLYLMMALLSPEISVLIATLLGCLVGVVTNHDN